jgi:hypothetical protein
MMARTIHAPSRQEYAGYALDAEIRRLVSDVRRWRRQPWEAGQEARREAELYLSYLFSIRRDARRTWRAEDRRVRRAADEVMAALERLQVADPEAPDYFALMTESELRWVWGDR